MDPQQRLLLEASYEALHAASRRRPELLGSADVLGVFVGITNTDYKQVLAGRESVYAATGDALSVAGGRVSFAPGLHGPCQSVDTACSSAVVALHSASLCLGANDCDGAVVASPSLLLSPSTALLYARAGMLSVDGRCKTWDSYANGYVRSEGAGAGCISQRSAPRLWLPRGASL